MAKTKEERQTQTRIDYAQRKEIPECPRCGSRMLEFKQGKIYEHFIWCAECRRKNRKYKGLGTIKDIQKLADNNLSARQVEQKGGQAI